MKTQTIIALIFLIFLIGSFSSRGYKTFTRKSMSLPRFQIGGNVNMQCKNDGNCFFAIKDINTGQFIDDDAWCNKWDDKAWGSEQYN
jgi:hypothetical protein